MARLRWARPHDGPVVQRPVLTSERVRLVPMAPEHLPLLHRLDTDAEVMRYLLGRARSPAEVEAFWAPICSNRDMDALGLGWWVGFQGGEFLGWWDLSPGSPPARTPGRPTEAEIGWRLERRHWGQGFATEGALLVVRHGFQTVGLDRIWAETMAVNAASRAVMRKLGMRHVRTEVRQWDEPIPGAHHGEVVCELAADTWRDQHESSAQAVAAPGAS